MMQQMKLYTTFLTENGDVVCVIPVVRHGHPEQPKILYDGHDHALFYRAPGQTFVLDYINEAIQIVLKQTDKVLLFEVDLDQQNIITDYFVPVVQTERLPAFQLDETVEEEPPSV